MNILFLKYVVILSFPDWEQGAPRPPCHQQGLCEDNTGRNQPAIIIIISSSSSSTRTVPSAKDQWVIFLDKMECSQPTAFFVVKATETQHSRKHLPACISGWQLFFSYAQNLYCYCSCVGMNFTYHKRWLLISCRGCHWQEFIVELWYIRVLEERQ